jgi:hypothetical protein
VESKAGTFRLLLGARIRSSFACGLGQTALPLHSRFIRVRSGPDHATFAFAVATSVCLWPCQSGFADFQRSLQLTVFRLRCSPGISVNEKRKCQCEAADSFALTETLKHRNTETPTCRGTRPWGAEPPCRAGGYRRESGPAAAGRVLGARCS